MAGKLVEAAELQTDKWRLKFFRAAELACNCCGRVFVSPHAEYAWTGLDALREKVDMPFRVNSGTRCEEWNTYVGGAPQSKHLQGIAFDIAVPDRFFRTRVLWHAASVGVVGVGHYPKFIHIDWRHAPDGVKPIQW